VHGKKAGLETLEDAHRFARIATRAAFTDTSLRLILPVEIQSCAFGERCSRYGLHARGVAERTMSLYWVAALTTVL